MNIDDKELTPSEKLNAQNEIDQMKLELDGATFFKSSDAPPELIAQFLKNIKKFEKGNTDPEVTVLHHLGNPTLPSNLSEDSDEIAILIASIDNLCADNGVNIIKPAHRTRYGVYRFYMDDVMPHMIQPPVPGMTLVLDYDDFYEDGIYYLESITQRVVESIIDLEYPFDPDLLADICRTVEDQISKSTAVASIKRFREKYSKIIPISFSLTERQAAQGAIFQMFGIEWEGTLNLNGAKESYEGMGICQLNLHERKWRVEGVTFPGFDF